MATSDATSSDEMKDENSSQNANPPPVAIPTTLVNAHLNSNDDGRERSPQGRYVKVYI